MLVKIISGILGICSVVVLFCAVVNAILCFKEYKHYDCIDESMNEKGSKSLWVATAAAAVLISVILINI